MPSGLFSVMVKRGSRTGFATFRFPGTGVGDGPGLLDSPRFFTTGNIIWFN